MRKTRLISALTCMSILLTSCIETFHYYHEGAGYNHGGIQIWTLSETRPAALIFTGQLRLKDLKEKGVKLYIKVSGFEPGIYNIHLHQIGKCSALGFESAGEHFAPAQTSNTNPSHEKGIMELKIGSNGIGETTYTLKTVSLHGAGNLPALRDTDGTSLIIHKHQLRNPNQDGKLESQRHACTVIPNASTPN